MSWDLSVDSPIVPSSAIFAPDSAEQLTPSCSSITSAKIEIWPSLTSTPCRQPGTFSIHYATIHEELTLMREIPFAPLPTLPCICWHVLGMNCTSRSLELDIQHRQRPTHLMRQDKDQRRSSFNSFYKITSRYYVPALNGISLTASKLKPI